MASNEHRIQAIGGLVVPVLASDPASPSDGAVWYNSVTTAFMQRAGGATVSSLTNPMTTAGDLIVGGVSGAPTRLGIGTANYVLTSDGSTPGYSLLVNANIDAAAAIALFKLAAVTASKALVSDGSGFVSASATTATEIGYVSGVTSGIQGQLDAISALAANGYSWHLAVRAMSTTNVVIASELEDGDTLQGLTLATGDRVLLTGQTTGSQNGIYVVAASGAASRASDADAFAKLGKSAAVSVGEGDFADRGFVQVTELSSFSGQVWSQIYGLGTYTADESTLTLSGANVFSVKTGGITDTQVSATANIDASKLGTGSVSNTEFGYLDGVTSAIQTQFGAKVDASGGTLTAGTIATSLTVGDSVFVHGGNGMRVGSSTSAYFETELENALTLADNTSGTAIAALGLVHGTYGSEVIEYQIREATTNNMRVGRLLVVSNGTDTSVTDSSTDTADVGVTWDLNVSGGTTQVRYTTTSTGNARTMRCVIRRLLA